MFRIFFAFTFIFSVVCFSSELPTFNDFNTQVVSSERIKVIDASKSEHAIKYHTHLKSIIGNKSNFAGHYYLTSMGCGTMCQVFIAVEVSSGEVVDVLQSSLGGCFQEDSRLFITNPKLLSMYSDAIPDWAYSNYYKMTENGFELILQTKVQFPSECRFGQ